MIRLSVVFELESKNDVWVLLPIATRISFLFSEYAIIRRTFQFPTDYFEFLKHYLLNISIWRCMPMIDVWARTSKLYQGLIHMHIFLYIFPIPHIIYFMCLPICFFLVVDSEKKENLFFFPRGKTFFFSVYICVIFLLLRLFRFRYVQLFFNYTKIVHKIRRERKKNTNKTHWRTHIPKYQKLATEKKRWKNNNEIVWVWCEARKWSISKPVQFDFFRNIDWKTGEKPFVEKKKEKCVRRYVCHSSITV